MRTLYQDIVEAKAVGKRLLAVLIDPEKFDLENTSIFFERVNTSIATHIFVGGSTDKEQCITEVVLEIKKHTSLPVILFPGDIDQITNNADGLLFLSLISGRNPEYLIGKHIEAVSKLKGMDLEVIPTGYILIENGKQTAVERVSQTTPMKREAIQTIGDTAKAGELLGMKLMYLEAGSGATHPVPSTIISHIKSEINIPLIVGGGIRTKEQLDNAYKTGADIVVVGTALENDNNFLNKLS
ncbi:geranylgeranylglyceryl/heptaprenylglyceryl phosphate synthase [Winogradskyella sp. A3E31]|uniref:geranylgeranylglyceryl/heptaprenylglyceryl phosphate synthase n=1 Tax=Winogradskyella sp. A3E31 TaxID=3349637 RepID=UPI00398AF5D0